MGAFIAGFGSRGKEDVIRVTDTGSESHNYTIKILVWNYAAST